jgi:hypothetical protein
MHDAKSAVHTALAAHPARTALILAVATLALSACGGYRPPLALTPQPERYTAAPYDTAWARAVSFFANNNLPLQTLDKANGLLSSARVDLSPRQAMAWANCGKWDGDPVITTDTDPRTYVVTASISVTVHTAQNATAVRSTISVNGAIRGWRYASRLDCVSTGKFEDALFNYVTR